MTFKQRLFASSLIIGVAAAASVAVADNDASSGVARTTQLQNLMQVAAATDAAQADAFMASENLQATELRNPIAIALEESGTQVAEAPATNYDPPVEADLTFVFHIDDDLAEQDIFVERAGDPGVVYRPTKGDRDMSKPLYAVAEPVPHQPFDPDALGPFKKGKPLGLTLGEWFEAEGRGKYRCENGVGALRVEFTKLVPNGVYTMWHAFMAWPPTEPFIGTYDLPIGARNGDDSVFITDEEGNATVERSFKPCLQLTGEHLAAELAIAWHSDRRTYGPLPRRVLDRVACAHVLGPAQAQRDLRSNRPWDQQPCRPSPRPTPRRRAKPSGSATPTRTPQPGRACPEPRRQSAAPAGPRPAADPGRRRR